MAMAILLDNVRMEWLIFDYTKVTGKHLDHLEVEARKVMVIFLLTKT